MSRKINLILALFLVFIYSCRSDVAKNDRKEELRRDSIAFWHRWDSIYYVRCKAIVCEELKRGNLVLFEKEKYGGRYYDDVLFDRFGIIRLPFDSLDFHVAKHMMDSVIFAKFGKDVYKTVKIIADSLERSGDCFIDSGTPGYKRASFESPRRLNTEESNNGYSPYFDFIVDSVLRSENLIYPKVIPWSCSVWIEAVVDERGVMRNVRLVKKIRPDIDKHIMRIFSEFPYRWTPASYRARKVKSKVLLNLKCPSTKLVNYPAGWQGEAKPDTLRIR